MSIIHDALKKVQQAMQKPSEPAIEPVPVVPPVAAPPVVQSEPKPAANDNPWAQPVVETPKVIAKTEPKPNPLSSFLMVLLCLIVILGCAYFIYSQVQAKYPRTLPKINPASWFKSITKKPAAKPVAATPAPVSVVAAPTAATKTETPATTGIASVNLQGIMDSGTHKVALINNNIYETGAVIQGYTLKDISINAVILEKDGNYETLRLKNAL